MKILSTLLTLSILAMAVMAVPPVAWGPVHRHTEIQYTIASPGYVQKKEFAYDFNQMSMRVEGTYLSGPVEYEFFNLTSWWINNTLTMQTFIGPFPTCTQLDMGFGIPVPDWFLFDATTVDPGLYLTRQYNGSDGLYHRAVWTRKSAMPDGYFNYFSFNDTGAPFRMSAPSPAGEVVNEYYNFENVSGFPAGTFSIPANCTVASPAHTLTEVDTSSMDAFHHRLFHIAAKELRLPRHHAEVLTSFVAQQVLMALTNKAH